MHMFYINRKYLYTALIILIIVYVVLFYIISLEFVLFKKQIIENNPENIIYKDINS